MEPLVLTSSDHVPFCELLGLQAHACWPDGEAFMMANDTQLKAMADGDAMAHMHAIGEYRSKNVQAAAVSALAALRTFRPAMLLTGVLDWLVCEPLAMLLGVPAVYTGLQPNALTAEMRSGFGESPRFAYIAMLAQFILTVKLGAAPEIKLVREALDKELNRDNPLGYEGALAESFRDTVKRMWSGQFASTKKSLRLAGIEPATSGSYDQCSTY